jgi:hypothetical protein
MYVSANKHHMYPYITYVIYMHISHTHITHTHTHTPLRSIFPKISESHSFDIITRNAVQLSPWGEAVEWIEP